MSSKSEIESILLSFDLDALRKKLGMMEEQWYVLDSNMNPHKVSREDGWASLNNGNHMQSDVIGVYRVSTVFLGLDHNHTGRLSDRPILFETLVSGSFSHCAPFQQRSCSWIEAQKIHRYMCKLLRKNEPCSSLKRDSLQKSIRHLIVKVPAV